MAKKHSPKIPVKLIAAILGAVALTPIVISIIGEIEEPNPDSIIDSAATEYTFPGYGEDYEKTLTLDANKFPDGNVLWGFTVGAGGISYSLDGIPTQYHVELTGKFVLKLYPVTYYDDDFSVVLWWENLNGTYHREIALKVDYELVYSIEVDPSSIVL